MSALIVLQSSVDSTQYALISLCPFILNVETIVQKYKMFLGDGGLNPWLRGNVWSVPKVVIKNCCEGQQPGVTTTNSCRINLRRPAQK
jgi:hypothetical protein